MAKSIPAPNSDDTITISDADHAIIRRALMERIDRLHATAAEVARVHSPIYAQPLLVEAANVGTVLDVIGVRS